MTGRRYYLTTLGEWQRHSARFANSHWLALSEPSDASDDSAPIIAPGEAHAATSASTSASTHIIALIEADEGAHLALEDDASFEALPHPLAQKPISEAAQAALAPHGVAPGANTFDASEVIARIHPLLRHRVF